MNLRATELITSAILVLANSWAATAAPPAPGKPDASDTLFDRGEIPHLRIEIAPEEMAKLRAENRAYVRCTVKENDRVVYKDVAIKLKGAAGSFREIDDRPALTLNVDKFKKGQSFHDLHKFHLNNSVQDETYLHELICSEIFRAAKIPTPRVTHARVWLNGRHLGFYVLKEGFDKKFLQRHFADGSGNLYDGGFLQDIDVDLEKDTGDGPDDRSDLKALLAACREPDPAMRWEQMGKRLDVEAFLTLAALDLMMCDWDGYVANKNNYRLYFDPTSKRAHILPHGMDQMFGDPGFPILDPPGSILGSTVMQNAKWRARYRELVKQLLPVFAPADKLNKRIDEVAKRLAPQLKAIDPQLAIDHQGRVTELKERLVARAENLREQSARAEPKPLEFDKKGVVQIGEWYPQSENDEMVLDEVELPGPKSAYRIACGASGNYVASWRRKVLLSRGKYRLEANVRTAGVVSLADEKGGGAGLRISGANRANQLAGKSAWKSLTFEFTVEEDSRWVELVAELRASKGEAWFQADSMRLVKSK